MAPPWSKKREVTCMGAFNLYCLAFIHDTVYCKFKMGKFYHDFIVSCIGLGVLHIGSTM